MAGIDDLIKCVSAYSAPSTELSLLHDLATTVKAELAAADAEQRSTATSLAGLQQLVETLVNRGSKQAFEADERWLSTKARLDAIDADRRPLSTACESKAQRLERELAETITARDEAVEVCAQLRRDLRAAVNLAESYRVQMSALTEAAESRTVTAIAAHLEQRAQAILKATSGGGYTRESADTQHRAAGLTDAADALRSDSWRTK